MSIHSFARDTVSRPPTYDDAPAPLSDNERKLLQRMFSDYFEVPGEWKTALKADLERDPPILGKSTLGGQSAVLAPNSVYSVHIFDGTIVDADVNALNKDGAQNVPSMRTLGTGHQQAAAGDDPRFAALGGDKTYVHNQATLSPVWTVIHALGKYVAIEVVDTGGSIVIPNVQYDSVNQVTLTFGTATSGKAYCN